MSKPITCFLVDDEPLARLRMTQLLTSFPEIEIVGEFGNGTSCIEATLQEAPALLFLDIGLPDHNGLEVVSELASEMTTLPAIVFATAFNEHAVSAFELNALDYLLKPVALDRLRKTIERVRSVIGENSVASEDRKIREWMAVERKARANEFLSRIEIRERGSLRIIPLEEISLFEADGNYIEIHATERDDLLRMTMARLESQLDPEFFLRISRSAIVPIHRVVNTNRISRSIRTHAALDDVIIRESHGQWKSIYHQNRSESFRLSRRI